MPMLLPCPQCQGRIGIPDGAVGKQVQCPRCRHVFLAPGPQLASALRVTESPGFQPAPRPALDQVKPGLPSPSVTEPPRRGPYPDDDPRLSRLVRIPDRLPGGLWVILTISFLGLCLVFATGRAWGMYAQYLEMDRLLLDRGRRFPVFEGLGIFTILMTGLQVLTGIAVAVFACMWVYRAHANCRMWSAPLFDFSSGMAVAWFFIPIANLLVPLFVLQEIWRASKPDAEGRG